MQQIPVLFLIHGCRESLHIGNVSTKNFGIRGRGEEIAPCDPTLLIPKAWQQKSGNSCLPILSRNEFICKETVTRHLSKDNWMRHWYFRKIIWEINELNSNKSNHQNEVHPYYWGFLFCPRLLPSFPTMACEKCFSITRKTFCPHINVILYANLNNYLFFIQEKSLVNWHTSFH